MKISEQIAMRAREERLSDDDLCEYALYVGGRHGVIAAKLVQLRADFRLGQAALSRVRKAKTLASAVKIAESEMRRRRGAQ